MNNKTLHSRSIHNAAWIIACRIVQSILGLAVTMISARYLGPSNYGLINYAASIMNFILPVMQLGLNSTLVQELVTDPESEGVTLGTALIMSMLSAVLGIIGTASFTLVANPGDRETQIVCILYGVGLLTRALEMTQYWFQAKLMSQYTSLSVLVAYILVSAYKIFLLITNKSIYYFAVAQSIDYLLIAISLLILYRRLGGQKLSFSVVRGKALLKKSRYYIISGIMITVFAQTDKIMLNLMVGEAATGFYSAAVACTTMTNFVFVAIVDSARPTVLKSKAMGNEIYERNVSFLYSVMFYLSLAQCVVVTLFAPPIIRVLYGTEYAKSIDILRLCVWYTTFSYLGSARSVWILAENMHYILWKMNLLGALTNILLNSILIPVLGAMGAALASLITQGFTNVLLGFLIKPIRENNRLMVRGMNPRFLYRECARLIKRRS